MQKSSETADGTVPLSQEGCIPLLLNLFPTKCCLSSSTLRLGERSQTVKVAL